MYQLLYLLVEQVPVAAKSEETARAIAEHFRRGEEARGTVGDGGRRPGKNSRRRDAVDQRKRLLHVTLLGRMERLPSGNNEQRSTARDVIVTRSCVAVVITRLFSDYSKLLGPRNWEKIWDPKPYGGAGSVTITT